MLGEVFDQAEDRKTRDVGRTPFSGGTLLVADGILEAGNVKIAAIACFAVAACLGILITVIQKAPWLLALGLFGGFSAAFYSTPPIRLVKRGFGEIFIGICYGWLPLVTGYGTATGSMPPQSWLYFWPVALTVFNIILINEFPDHVPDSTSGKRNFLVRVGMKTGSIVYALASVAAGVMLLVIWFHYRGESLNHLLITLPAAALSFVLAGMAAFTRKWESPSTIGPLCGMTIVLNLVSAVTVAVLVRW
jgi:1,4-dihydroxy-2-naphthoate octaprenyltransferase